METYDFSQFRVIADIGGGEGMLLSSVLKTHPTARGILFDLPHVIADSLKRLVPALKPRVDFVPGDFFRSPYAKQSIDALAASLPKPTRVVLTGQEHNAMDGGRDILARAILKFAAAQE